MSVSGEQGGRRVTVSVGTESRSLSPEEVTALRERLTEAVTDRREFEHTACEHREDGTYVVERRGADSAGHRKVFESFEVCRRRFEALPREFTASTVTGEGLSGSRRHMLLRHFAEHPGFGAELVARQPLTVHKTDPGTGSVR